MSSTGSTAIYINSSKEANHGDLGIIEKNDVIVALSKSGETKEMIPLINYAKNIKINLLQLQLTLTAFYQKMHIFLI